MAAWQNKPFVIEVKSGDIKAFCTCGLSKSGPFCDGSHRVTDKRPNVMKFESDKTIYACGCRESQNQPFCDGSHSKI